MHTELIGRTFASAINLILIHIMCYLTDGAQSEIARYDRLDADTSACSLCLRERYVHDLINVPVFRDFLCVDCIDGHSEIPVIHFYAQRCGEDFTLFDEYEVRKAFAMFGNQPAYRSDLEDARAYFDTFNEGLIKQINNIRRNDKTTTHNP